MLSGHVSIVTKDGIVESPLNFCISLASAELKIGVQVACIGQKLMNITADLADREGHGFEFIMGE